MLSHIQLLACMQLQLGSWHLLDLYLSWTARASLHHWLLGGSSGKKVATGSRAWPTKDDGAVDHLDG